LVAPLRALRAAAWLAAALHLALGHYLFILPAAIVVRDAWDPALSGPGVPRAAWRLFERLAPRYERWARARLASSRARELALSDIAGTEWPLFGSVFFLWAVESLQAAWERDRSLAPRPPRETARGAIAAAAALVLDPGQASWVKRHWGEREYLSRENVAYRTFLIAAATAEARLLGERARLPLLRAQVEGLAAELDASPHGMLDDYPGECYPADVLWAVAAIRRADALLGSDRSAFAARARRGFAGALVDARGLPPYATDARRGRFSGSSRGCSNSYLTLGAPELWPEVARRWYAAYERHFWQRRLGAVGFREFPSDLPGGDWYIDVDAGPVVAGFGFAASAFGVGAARVNGRFDHARPLAAQLAAIVWPLPDGTLAGPRLLSNAVDAPYLGEACILYILTRQPQPGVAIVAARGGPTPFVYVMLALYSALGGLFAWCGVRRSRWARHGDPGALRAPRVRLAVFAALVLGGGVGLILGWPALGLALLLAAPLALPGRSRRRNRPG
jgi:hypothetical protein